MSEGGPIDTDRLAKIATWLDGVDGSNMHGILVVRNGNLAFEHYRAGPDERWGKTLPDAGHGPLTRHDLRSVTKVVTGLLTGMLVDRGLIRDLDVPVFEFFPDYSDLRQPSKDKITLRHLLTMSAGLEWNENLPISDPDHGELRLWRSKDPLRTALEPPLVAEPGTVWNYSGGCTEVLAAIVARLTGQPLEAFAQDALFAPLGIADIEWARLGNGAVSASGGLRMRAHDLAKIGQLVLVSGRSEGDALLSQDWIQGALSPQIGAPDRLFFYGYHWWLGRSLVARREIGWAAGIGLGGQRLFVIPDLDTVVVMTAGHYADAMQAWLPLTLLNRFILPAVL